MPYIALQLVGIQAVLDVMGVGGGENTNWFVKDLPLLIAFGVLAAYTYSSGLRAPALIAFVKDTLIYIVIAVAIIYIPIKLGGFDDIFAKAGEAYAQKNPATGKPRGALVTGRGGPVDVRHAGARLRARALHVPALDHRDALLAAAVR